MSMTRRTFVETGVAAAVAGVAAANSPERPSGARFIWYDAHGEGRNTFALFRKAFTVSGQVESASLHLFADTSYQLFVNGQFVEFGPVRCDPRFPLYDTHEIAILLRPGRNIIAVEVNFWGLKTFKAMPVRGGMVAWGAVKHEGGVADLTTRAGSWRATKSKSRARYAPALSFALPAADLFEQNSAEEGWKGMEFDDSAWEPSVELEKQDSWGELLPRSIPFMSAGPLGPAAIKGALVLPIERNEEWHSFSVPVPHHFADDASQFSNFVAFSTWLYSPREQTISAGVFHGRHWLNGAPVAKGTDSIDRPMRVTERWTLNRGWNYLFGSVDAYFDVLDEYFALPRDGGLVFSTDRDPGSPYTFRHSPILKAEEHDRYLKAKPQPYAADERLDGVGGWTYVKRGDGAQSPCRETSWDQYGDSRESLAVGPAGSLDGHTFRLADYPDGFAVQIDLEWMHLMLPHLRLLGVRGATLDVIYTERLSPDRQHVQQFSWYPVGDRALCTLDAIDWMPAGPRGARYCLLTVRNSQQDVTLEQFRLRAANFPAQRRGRFRCSDPCLTEVWRMCERTQATNMEDAFIDCAGRERGMYVRDTIIQYHVNLATFGYHALMRRCLELYGQSCDATGRFRIVYPNTGTYTYNDFALNMVEGYRNYYDATGDDKRIEADWAAIRGNLEYFHKWSDRRAGLLLENLPELGGFGGDSETPKTLGDHSGVSCFFSLSYLLAMQSALRLARAIGKGADAGELERRIAAISESISKTFWDPEKRCFRDNLKGATYSVHSNLFAVRAGIVTPEQLAGIRANVAEELRSPFVNGYDPSGGYRVSSHFSFYILEGLYKAGLVETAENLMRQGWGYFLAHGAKTTPEFFNMEQSLCHAWSASPAYYLSKHVLGIEFPEAPNLDVVRIAVHASSITEAEGVWPHPRGTIDVKWHMSDGRRIFDYVYAPAGVRVIAE
jgi:alpha-L-rhamnosidase